VIVKGRRRREIGGERERDGERDDAEDDDVSRGKEGGVGIPGSQSCLPYLLCQDCRIQVGEPYTIDYY
jgi:hypothetical protein